VRVQWSETCYGRAACALFSAFWAKRPAARGKWGSRAMLRVAQRVESCPALSRKRASVVWGLGGWGGGVVGRQARLGWGRCSVGGWG